MRRTNETRHIKWHEACKCKCRLDASVYNTKQWHYQSQKFWVTIIGIYNIGYITIKKNWWLWKYLQCKSFVFIYHANGYIEEKVVNKYLTLTLQMKIKSYQKNTIMFGMKLGAKSEK